MTGRDPALDTQLAEARALLAEVRGVTGDLHRAIVKARATFPQLAEDRIVEVVNVKLQELSDALNDQVRDAEDQIYRRFKSLGDMLLRAGKKYGSTQLEAVALVIAQTPPLPDIPGAALGRVVPGPSPRRPGGKGGTRRNEKPPAS